MMKKFLATILVISLNLSSLVALPQVSFAANTQIRQEINITDGYQYAASGSYATTSPRIGITDSNYSDPQYFLEVVASTTSATDAKVYLFYATSSEPVVSVTVNGTGYARYRSAAFVPNSSSTVEMGLKLGNEAVGKGIISSRIVILQNTATLNYTETQIELGNQESYTSVSTTTFSAPKYWYYDSTKWSPAPTFYAEVTYANTAQPGPTTGATTTNTFTQTGYFTVTASSTLLDIAGWGGGGAGKTGSANGGGDGGGGGAFASSTQAFTIGDTIRLSIGSGGQSSTANGASTTASTTAPATIIAADFGKGGAADATLACGTGTGGSGAGKGGLAGASIGTKKNSGGNGGSGCNASGNNDQAGGGGGGGGTHGNGAAGSDGSTTVGGGGGGGNNGNVGAQPTGGTSTNGGAGGNGGNSGNATAGADNANGGGGGGGGDNGTNGAAGGLYGGGGGGGEGTFGAGGNGVITLTGKMQTTYTATTTITLQESDGTGDGFTGWTDKQVVVSNGVATTPTRVRTAAFTPTQGRNYRLVFSSGFNGATFAIYNAKIIATQTTATTANYYFNASDAGPTDVDNVWSNDANGFDSDTDPPTSAATTATTDGLSSHLLKATGTNSPTSGGTITLVEFRAFYSETVVTPGFNVRTTDGGSLLLSVSPGAQSPAAWSAYSTVSVPSGGWTWQKVNDLYVDILKLNSQNETLSFYKAEVRVTSLNGTITNLQPQYLLAPTSLFSGTSLQKYLTSWLSTEWSTTNAYVFQGEAANNSSSVITLNTAAGALVTNSTISTIDNRATSTSMCMPSNGDLDTIATTNGGDIYAARILVDVGGTAPNCTVTVPQPASSLIFRTGFKFLAPFIKR